MVPGMDTTATAAGRLTAEAVHEWCTRLAPVDTRCLDVTGVDQLLADVAKIRRWCDGAVVAGAGRAAELQEVGEGNDAGYVIATQTTTTRHEADRILQRTITANEVPAVGQALAAGDLSAAHVDVITGALRRLTADDRAKLADQDELLAGLGHGCTPGEYRERVNREVLRLHPVDPVADFERQRRDTRLRTWTDRITGMYCLAGQFDPELGLRLDRAIRLQVETLFHDTHPDTTPDNAVEAHQHLQALALGALIGRSGPQSSPRSLSVAVVIDLETLTHGLHEHSLVDSGPVELPVETIRRMACDSGIIPVVVNGRGLPVDVGRASRLATASQRAALRAMYGTCEIPGCGVPFDRCTPHHITNWQHRGPTDLINLAVLCERHHHSAHEGRWQLVKTSDHVLRITLPDGTEFTGNPPRTRTAAA